MPKKYRLSRADFARLSRTKSRRTHGTYFFLAITSLPEGASVKAACVVPKKIASHAVDRNRIERRCRETLRPLLASVGKPVALIFHAKREAVAASLEDVRKDIETLLERNGLRDTMSTT